MFDDIYPASLTAGSSRSPRRRRRAGLLVSAALAASVVAGACGTGGSSPGVAKAQSSSTTAASSRAASTYRGDLAYAACVRAHGVPDFPDPTPGRGIVMNTNPNNPKLQAAEHACARLLPNGGQMTTGTKFTPAQVASLLDFARCMRAHGIVKFPDPSSTGMRPLPQGVDPSSPLFGRAQRACQSLMPKLGGNGPVTAGGGGS